MSLNDSGRFSFAATHGRPSPVRRILEFVKQPGMISFAGGMPAPEVFPVKEFAECSHLIRDKGEQLLQYGTTDGNPELRAFLAEFSAPRLGRQVTPDQVMLTTGSQQALDLIGWALIDPGDVIITENPSYMAALTVFQLHRASFRGIPCDADGMLVDRIPEVVESLRAQGKKVKMLYTVANFQNPGGMTLSADRRRRLAEYAAKYDFLVYEDDAYGYVRFEGEPVPAVFSFDPTGHTVYSCSFSKILAPGTRTGWIIADSAVITKMCAMKQNVDICSSSVDQALIAEYCEKGFLTAHLPVIISNYRRRRDFMEESMKKHLSPLGVTWVKPQGGFFYWIKVPGVDTDELVMKALEKKVAFVQGSAFAVEEGTCRDCARINYTYCSAETIEEGISRLADAIEEIKNKK